MYVNASDVGYDDCDVVVGSAMMMTGKLTSWQHSVFCLGL